MPRLNFTLDSGTVELLDTLSDKYYGGNKSLMVRAAVESLAVHLGHGGWVIVGYSPVVVDSQVECHSCHTPHQMGDILFRPVFERGTGANALPTLPVENWLDCQSCVESK